METIRVDLYRPRENAVVVSLRGELGAEPTPELSKRILEVLEHRPATIVLDCADVTRLGSRGIAEIVQLHEAASRYGGSVRIASAKPEHVRLIRALRLDSAMPVFGSVQDALIYED